MTDDAKLQTMTDLWHPMSEMTDEMRYAGGYLLHAPDLVDLDFNPQGVERGYWQDDEGWCAPGWDANSDVWTEGRVVHPTHFMVIEPPRVAETERTFVLHDGEDEARTEELHEFLRTVYWEGDESGVTIWPKIASGTLPRGDAYDHYVHADAGDTIARAADGSVSVRKKDAAT